MIQSCVAGEYMPVMESEIPGSRPRDAFAGPPEPMNPAEHWPQSGPAFATWLRAQLVERKISQRLLAEQSGVCHSTISRLLRGEHSPSLGTAMKLAKGSRLLGERADSLPSQLSALTRPGDPTRRVREALGSDPALSASQVGQVVTYYLAVRRKSQARHR
jgi:transcriptional regulator with XRE-family HTH domain